MRALVFCLLVSFCAYLGDALPRGVTKRPDSLSKRDTCSQVLSKTGEDPYFTCFNLLQSVQLDNPDSTESKVEAYCTAPEECPYNIRNLFQELADACPGGDPLPEQTRTITEICAVDLRGKYCGDDYISMFDSDMQGTYDDCINDFAGGKDCSLNCDTITEYIVNNIGCCYTIVEQYRTDLQGLKEVNSEIFTACGRTEPDPCDG